MPFPPNNMGSRSRKAFRTLAWLCASLAGCGFLAAQRVDPLQHQAWGTADGLPQASVHALAQTRDGFLWAATEDGLARFDGTQFRVYTHEELGRGASNDFCCLAVDPAGVLWIGSSDGLAALDGSRVIELPDRAPFTHSSIRQLSLQHGQAVALTDTGIFTLSADGRADQAAVASTPTPPLRPSLKDRDGDTWIASGDGLKRVPAGQSTAMEVPGLANQQVLSLLEDTEGDVWAGTETTGLHRLRHGVFHALEGSRGTPATAVASFANGIWLGTRTGELRVVNSGAEERIIGGFSGEITALGTAAGALWIGAIGGLYRTNNQARVTRYTSADGLPDDYIRSLAVSGRGEVWAGTPHGLAHFAGSHIEIFTSKNGLGGDLIGALLPTPVQPGQHAGVWAATESGLSLIEGGRVAQSLIVPASVVAGMAYDAAGTLWFATQDGWLWRYKSGSPEKVLQLPNVSARRAIRSLLIDRHETLWIVLRDGVLSASLPPLSACNPQNCRSVTSLIATWGVADGMPSAESLPGGFSPPALDEEGNVLFATRAGLAVADSARAAHIFPIPGVIESIAMEDRQLNPQQLRSIPYGRTRLTFEFAGLSLGEAARVRYRVRLYGFDHDWVETGIRRAATYTALAPGSYRFSVQATLEGQPWPESSATLTFRIAPPFYRRWWFLALGGLLLLAALFAFYRLRLAAERRRFELMMAERNRLAREVHDTLAQDLVSTGIQLDVVMLGLERQPQERTLDLLRTLRRRVAQALAEARESIGELRDPNVRLDLASRLRRMAERKSTHAVPVMLEVAGAPPTLKPGIEIELLRIATEAVENALRHAHASTVTVRLEATANDMSLSVIDNGRGFLQADAEALAGHYGLRGMHERADALGATLRIDSHPGRGTTVRISIGYSR